MEADLGSLILATDISRQNDYLSRFRRHLDQEDLCLSNASHRHFVLQVLNPPARSVSRRAMIVLIPLCCPEDGPEVRRHL